MHAIKTLPSSNKSFSRKVTIGADVLREDSDLDLVQNEGKEDNEKTRKNAAGLDDEGWKAHHRQECHQPAAA